MDDAASLFDFPAEKRGREKEGSFFHSSLF